MYNYIWWGEYITLTRAQALYDVSIAILQISTSGSAPTNSSSPAGSPSVSELTYEAYSYCSVLYNYIAGKYASCFTSTTYDTYVAANPTAVEATSVIYVTETDVAGGYLFQKNGALKFGMLVVPDIYAGSQDQIAQLLGSDGKTQLSQFLSAGGTSAYFYWANLMFVIGTIFSSGKGALVLQSLGIVNAGTFDTTSTIYAKNFANGVSGCGINFFFSIHFVDH